VHAGEPRTSLLLSRYELAEGRPAKALELAVEAADRFGMLGDRIDELSAQVVATQTQLAIGERVDARVRANTWIAVARDMSARFYENQLVTLVKELDSSEI
jgi:hypothetical protein